MISFSHEIDWTGENMQALAFIDLLGFSQMVGKNSTRSKQILSDFYNITYQIIRENEDVKGNLFSDSLLAYSTKPDKLVNAVTKIYRACLRKNKSYSFDLSTHFLLPRGGISYGMVEIQERTEAPNLSKNFIVSPALVHSAKMESQIKGGRLLIADLEGSNDRVFNWNRNIDSILYKNSTFTFWSNFQYFDALWFLDLRKTYEQQKLEVTELIETAITLAKCNSGNNRVLEQHLQTLRIGLLSYSKFLTPNSNPLLNQIISEFEDDKYWLVWLTLFEVIMQSPDNWAFPAKSEIIQFYKNVSLKSTWANVIKEINKPKNEYKKTLLNRFIEELSINQI